MMRRVYDHVVKRGPQHYDFLCTRCGCYTADHAVWFVVVWKRIFRRKS